MGREAITFVLVGGFVTLSHIAVAILAEAELSFPPQMANLAGYVTAIGISYFGHAYFTFRVANPSMSSFIRFLTISLIGLAIGATIVAVLGGEGGLPFWIVMVCVGLVVSVSTFLMSKFWVFAAVRGAASDFKRQ